MKQITAECHSDDFAVECQFNATRFFEKVKGHDIIALAECGWGGDYPADEVAMYAAGYDKQVSDMFKYIEIRNKNSKEKIGFECHVDENPAMTWLKNNRPRIHAKILKLAE
jgi:hypothetical protein